GRLAGLEHIVEHGNQRRSSKAPPPDDNAVAIGPAHHPKSILGSPYAAVAQHWNLHRSLELADRPPIRVAVVELRSGSGVQADCSAPFILGDAAGRKERMMFRIDPYSELDGYRNLLRIGDCSANDSSQEIRLQWNRCAAALSGDFGNRAPEVHIEMIDAAFVDEAFDGFRNVVWIHAIQLQASWKFVRTKVGQFQSLVASIDKGSGVD